jgi:hypothetical protein
LSLCPKTLTKNSVQEFYLRKSLPATSEKETRPKAKLLYILRQYILYLYALTVKGLGLQDTVYKIGQFCENIQSA